MKNTLKGLGLSLIALALVAVIGVNKANADLTFAALAASSNGALTITSAGALGLVAGANAINIGADATAKTITIGSSTTTSTLALLAGSGGVNVTGTLAATSPKITTSVLDTNGLAILGLSPAASAVNYLQLANSATATNLSLTALGTDANISISYNTKGSGVHRFQEQSAAGDVIAIMPQTAGAGSFTGNITSADLTGNVTWTFPNATTTVAGLAVAQTFSANQTIGAGIKLVLDSGTCTSTAAACTLSKQAGIVTSEALTTAAAGTWSLVLTNTLITASSNILAQATLGTATTGTPLVTKITPGAGSATIVVTNIAAAAALNGTILVNFTLVN